MNESKQTAEPITQESIAERAYRLWEQAGRTPGRDMDFWLQAEAELRQEPAAQRDTDDSAGEAPKARRGKAQAGSRQASPEVSATPDLPPARGTRPRKGRTQARSGTPPRL